MKIAHSIILKNILKRKYRTIISLSLLLISSFIVTPFVSINLPISLFFIMTLLLLFISVVLLGFLSWILFFDLIIERIGGRFFLPDWFYDIEYLDIFYIICFLTSILIILPSCLFYFLSLFH
jgi:hypothetical protein